MTDVLYLQASFWSTPRATLAIALSLRVCGTKEEKARRNLQRNSRIKTGCSYSPRSAVKKTKNRNRRHQLTARPPKRSRKSSFGANHAGTADDFLETFFEEQGDLGGLPRPEAEAETPWCEKRQASPARHPPGRDRYKHGLLLLPPPSRAPPPPPPFSFNEPLSPLL